MLAEFREGLCVFRKDKNLACLVLAQALCMFFYAPLSSFYPLMTSDYFDLSAMYGSAVELCFALGMAVSSLLFSSVLKINRKLRTSYIGLFGMGAISAACGLLPPTLAGWFIFALLCAGLGASGNVHTIPLTAYIQETVEEAKMGRAFSVLTLVSSVTMPVGLLLSSPAAEQVGVHVWFSIAGIDPAGFYALSGHTVSRLKRPISQHLGQEVLEARVLGIGEKFLGLVLLNDVAAVHEQHAGADLARKAHLVGHDDHGHAVVRQLFQIAELCLCISG